MSRAELQGVLDYILNRAEDAEFEVIQKACERRARDAAAFSALGGRRPGAFAKEAAEGIAGRMGASLEGIRANVKTLVSDIIRKNAPEIGEEELRTLLEAWVPDPALAGGPGAADGGGAGGGPTLAPEALLSMVRQFVEYSEGRMAPSRQREIWEEMPRWQEAYWAAFPPELKALVKAYLDGRLDGDGFGTALLSVLGL